MRYPVWLLGALAVGACSVDQIVVAALDANAGANAGGMLASAGSAGADAGGLLAAGGTQSQGDGGRILTTGGSNVGVQIGPDGGAPVIICSCENEQAELCGSDGVTYPTACEDGGPCIPPAIACWHACPCLPGESATREATSWISLDCVRMTQCTGDFVCLAFANAMRETPLGCPDAGN